MPALMIKCPTTKKLTPTGFAMDKTSFEDPTNRLFSNQSQCVHCGQMHMWDKKDAVLAQS